MCDCQKKDACVCSCVTPQQNKTFVLILQHPQEPKEILSTAILARKTLLNSRLVVGLSWPNLKQILGPQEHLKDYVTLYLGSAISSKPVDYLYKKSFVALSQPPKGLIVLDGTWSQVKALWWRNPWLSKTVRMILNCQTPSLYGFKRKEPRKNCLSTIESIAYALSHLHEHSSVETALINIFKQLLQKV